MGNRGQLGLGVLIFVVGTLGAGVARAEPQLLAYGELGVRSGDVTIFEGPVEGATYDAAQDLVWFKSKGTLQVIDLRAATPAPILIAKKMPFGAFAIEGVSNAAFDTDYAGIYPVLDIGTKTTVGTGSGAYGNIWNENDRADKKAIKKIQIVGKKWLKAQRKRKPNGAAQVSRLWPSFDATVTLPAGEWMCDGGGLGCGDAGQFGTTGYQLVVMESSCGDACGASCVLYDPRTGLWASPLEEQSSWSTTIGKPGDCWGYGLRDDGAYFLGSQRCTITDEVRCVQAPGWSYFGWVATAPIAETKAPAGPATLGSGGLRVAGTPLFAGAVTAADYDEAQDLIWFVSGSTLQVIDLRTTARKPVVIAKTLPSGLDVVISGWSSARVRDPAVAVDLSLDSYTELVLGTRPKVLSVFEQHGPAGGFDERKPNKKVKLAGATWLKKQRSRKARTLAPSPEPKVHTVALSQRWLEDCPPPPACTSCTDEEEVEQPRCAGLDGSASAFGSTGLELVVIFDVEFQEPRCALRDPATGRFADPAGGSWTDEVSSTNSCRAVPHASAPTYLLGGAVCRVEATGVACAVPADGKAFAWVGD
jgi:hypothetical protein